MSVNLSIKNVPDEVVEAIRGRAVRNQRTLNQELVEILKGAAQGQAGDPGVVGHGIAEDIPVGGQGHRGG